MTNSTGHMKELQSEIDDFVQRRNWSQYHSPKNLAMALSVEASEIVEIFQWMDGEESRLVDDDTLSHIEEEIGDVMIYLTMLAQKYGLDPISAARKKMERNRKRYPEPERSDNSHTP